MQFKPIKDLMYNMLRSERGAYAHAVGKAWLRAIRSLGRKPVPRTEEHKVVMACLTYRGYIRPLPG